MLCPNCYTHIEDKRKAVACTSCEKPVHRECGVKEEDGTYYCDICYLEKEREGNQTVTLPDVIRRTYIETYRTCPHKFLLEVIEGNQQPPTMYTQIGIDLHDLFEKASLDRGFTKENMLEEFTKIWDNYSSDLFPTPEDKERMWERAERCIYTFYDILPSFPKKPFTTEEKIVFSVGENIPKVSITMDRIDEIDGELEMIDYKTGRVMVGQKLSTDLQAPLYIYAVQQHFKKPVRKFTFYYLDENKYRVFERVEGKEHDYVCTVGKRQYFINVIDAIREVQSLFNRMSKGDFNIPEDTKKMRWVCKMCHLREAGLCAGADEESWYQINGGRSYQ